jgi:NAD(P)-dependent dehydrogenase (short-subunit alcohol dehydrogenase family)
VKILVTGTSTGIGLATALHFARNGHEVFGGMRNPAALPDDVPFRKVRLDVTSDESVGDAVRTAGPVDVLVNNAGIGGGGAVELAPLEHAKAVFETNYFGAVRMIRAVLPAMRERGSGTIVNVTSVAGRTVGPTHSHYAASKYALEALSEGLALEVAVFGIRVAIIEPGVVDTPIFSKHSESVADPGPYAPFARRLWHFFESRLKEGATMPETVAEVIANAVTTTEPKLRYLVGPDASAIMAVRSTTTDEEWMRLVATLDDNEYYSGMKALFDQKLSAGA